MLLTNSDDKKKKLMRMPIDYMLISKLMFRSASSLSKLGEKGRELLPAIFSRAVRAPGANSSPWPESEDPFEQIL